jgi:hypothetical protein
MRESSKKFWEFNAPVTDGDVADEVAVVDGAAAGPTTLRVDFLILSGGALISAGRTAKLGWTYSLDGVVKAEASAL